jgi:predicted transcriptional regulator
MTESLDNLVLQHLRHIRGRVDQIADDMTTVKLRLSTIEEGLALMRRGTALDEQTLAQLQAKHR